MLPFDITDPDDPDNDWIDAISVYDIDAEWFALIEVKDSVWRIGEYDQGSSRDVYLFDNAESPPFEGNFEAAKTWCEQEIDRVLDLRNIQAPNA